MKTKIIFLVHISFVWMYSQIPTPRKFTAADSNKVHSKFHIVQIDSQKLAAVWTDDDIVKSAVSNNLGITWSVPQLISNLPLSVDPQAGSFLYRNASDRIFLVFRQMNESRHTLFYSDNYGANWSQPIYLSLDTIQSYPVKHVSMSESPDGKLWITYTSYYGVTITKSTDFGLTWSNPKLIVYGFYFNAAHLVFHDTLRATLYHYNTNNKKLSKNITIDQGSAWGSTSNLYISSTAINPIIISFAADELLCFYDEKTSIGTTYYSDDVYLLRSTNGGTNFNSPFNLTEFAGPDNVTSVSSFQNKSLYAFRSNRTPKSSLYFGIYPGTNDTICPPFINGWGFIYGQPEPNQPLTITCEVADDDQINEVRLFIYFHDTLYNSYQMYNDKNHGVNQATYGVYFANITLPYSSLCSYDILAFDSEGNSFRTPKTYFSFPSAFGNKSFLFDVNKIKLPIDNKGVLADVYTPGLLGQGAYYDDGYIIFSSGFYLSGKNNGILWANGQQSSARIGDYQAGKVGTNPSLDKHVVYSLRSSDTPFGLSWQNWIEAVNLGAKFYDGNNDGLYTPVDLNNNGTWDLNEDKPDLIGDLTAWCVYNDGVPSSQRRYTDVNPLGIEIKQTVFASRGYNSSAYENMIFVRYEIENKGTVSNLLDSVYFSAAADDDIGFYPNDLVGCDSTINSGYTYSVAGNDTFGVNPPAVFATMLQGAQVYIPGVTFIDVNQNGIFDPGIDIPLHSANLMHGPHLGTSTIIGAKNLPMTSFIHYMSSHPTLGDPSIKFDLRNYQLGRQRDGTYINPCTWPFGNGAQLPNCGSINPLFIYSGDPASSQGWLNTTPIDQRKMVNTGPFNLKVGKPIEIMIGIIVGRGTTALNSVTVGKNYALTAINTYHNNFIHLPTDIDEIFSQQPKEFSLAQNYPNPFNPATRIQYQVSPANNSQGGAGSSSHVTLKVYDILGREVATLVNENKQPGSYEIEFNASKFASGIYFYQLKAGDFIQTKKMILLR